MIGSCSLLLILQALGIPSYLKGGIIKVYVRKLFKLKNDGKKEYLCLLSICTANLNGINNMNHIQTLFKVFSIDNRLSM